MKDSKLGVVEDTLYVPMLGRIYASENHGVDKYVF